MQKVHRTKLLTVTIASLMLVTIACAKTNIGGKDKGTTGVQLGGGSNTTCLKLGDAAPVQAKASNDGDKGSPAQMIGGKGSPAQMIGGKGSPAQMIDNSGKGPVDVVVVPAPAPTPAPLPPVTANTPDATPPAPVLTGKTPDTTPPLAETPPTGNCAPQGPSQTPPAEVPTNLPAVKAPPVVDNGPVQTPPSVNNGPGQMPPLVPGNDSNCGKGSIYCAGGPGQAPQWPGQAVGGGSYSHDDVASCLNAFHGAGLNTNGQWNIDVRSSLNISVLSGGLYDDHSTDHSLIIIKSVSVLGQMHFNLLNPNALYCLKDVSVLDQVSVTSCYQSNVVSLKDVSVLSSRDVKVVDCAAH